jgi:hypothetical protein
MLHESRDNLRDIESQDRAGRSTNFFLDKLKLCDTARYRRH